MSLIAEGEALADELTAVVKTFAALEEIGGGEVLYQARNGDLGGIEDPPEDLVPVVALWREMPRHYEAHRAVERAVDRWRDAGYEFLTSSFDDSSVAKRFQRASGPWVAGSRPTIDQLRQLERQVEAGVSQLSAVRDAIDFYPTASGSPPQVLAPSPTMWQTFLTAIVEHLAIWVLIATLLLIVAVLIAVGLLNPDLLDVVKEWIR